MMGGAIRPRADNVPWLSTLRLDRRHLSKKRIPGDIHIGDERRLSAADDVAADAPVGLQWRCRGRRFALALVPRRGTSAGESDHTDLRAQRCEDILSENEMVWFCAHRRWGAPGYRPGPFPSRSPILS
jgi:hypothetical protein